MAATTTVKTEVIGLSREIASEVPRIDHLVTQAQKGDWSFLSAGGPPLDAGYAQYARSHAGRSYVITFDGNTNQYCARISDEQSGTEIMALINSPLAQEWFEVLQKAM